MTLRSRLNLCRILTFLTLVLAGAWLSAASEPGAKTVHAVFSEEAPQVDGELSDAVWNKAEVVSDFLQIVPVEGGTPSENNGLDRARVFSWEQIAKDTLKVYEKC